MPGIGRGIVVDDLDLCCRALEIGNIPTDPFHLRGIVTGCRTHDLTIDNQVNRGVIVVVPTGDKEIDGVRLNDK